MNPALIARAEVPVTADIVSIVQAAGGSLTDAQYANGVLTVRGVEQEALTAAAAAADPLYAARVMLKQQAEREFRRRLDLGMPFRGKIADIDEEQSQRRINGAVTGAILAQAQNAPFEIAWRMKDNTTLDLDRPSVMRLGTLVLTYFQMLNARKWSIINAATDAADVTALSAISPLTGWPDPPVEPPSA